MKEQAPQEIVAAVEAGAQRIETPYGGSERTMVWRRWGQGRPLVLLHGGQGAWTHWVHNVEGLAQKRTVFAADLPGYGDSATLPDPVSFETIVAAVIEGLNIIVPPPQSFDIAGFSFGSAIGAMVAADPKIAERIDKLILVGPGALGPSQRNEEFVNWREIADPEELAKAQRRNLEIQMINDPARIDDLAVYLQTLNTRRARTRSRKLIRQDPSIQQKVLPHVRARIHGIWGDRDVTSGALLKERGELLGRLQAGAGYSLIPGAGHWVAYEAPDRFNRLLLQVLDAEGEGGQAESRRLAKS